VAGGGEGRGLPSSSISSLPLILARTRQPEANNQEIGQPNGPRQGLLPIECINLPAACNGDQAVESRYQTVLADSKQQTTNSDNKWEKTRKDVSISRKLASK
jgi:hypothetical protein